MSIRKCKDLILGIVMLLFSGAYLYFAQQIKTRPKMTPGYGGARVIPTLLGILLAILSILLIIQTIRKIRKGQIEESGKKMERGDLVAVVLTFAVIIAYTALLRPLGFCASTVLYLFAQINILAPKEKRKLWLFALVAVVFTAIAFCVFRIGLQQMLPRGFIEALLGF